MCLDFGLFQEAASNFGVDIRRQSLGLEERGNRLCLSRERGNCSAILETDSAIHTLCKIDTAFAYDSLKRGRELGKKGEGREGKMK